MENIDIFATKCRHLEKEIGPFGHLKSEEALDFSMRHEKTCRDLGPLDPAFSYFVRLREQWFKASCLLEWKENQNKEEIPEDVYFREGNFYHRVTRLGMGVEFYDKWKKRAYEFPGTPKEEKWLK